MDRTTTTRCDAMRCDAREKKKRSRALECASARVIDARVCARAHVRRATRFVARIVI